VFHIIPTISSDYLLGHIKRVVIVMEKHRDFSAVGSERYTIQINFMLQISSNCRKVIFHVISFGYALSEFYTYLYSSRNIGFFGLYSSLVQ
jgi:hypothetical protein